MQPNLRAHLDLAQRLALDLDDAELKAWDALARYKFWMFGYWAAAWVSLNRLGGLKRENPFKPVVLLARQIVGGERWSR